jgi:hypothetical protein
MTVALTDEAREIVVHFTSHMPIDVRATYEAKVREMLKHRHDCHCAVTIDDEAIRATHVCTTVMWMLWSQARSEFKIAPAGLEVPWGGQLIYRSSDRNNRHDVDSRFFYLITGDAECS